MFQRTRVIDGKSSCQTVLINGMDDAEETLFPKKSPPSRLICRANQGLRVSSAFTLARDKSAGIHVLFPKCHAAGSKITCGMSHSFSICKNRRGKIINVPALRFPRRERRKPLLGSAHPILQRVKRVPSMSTVYAYVPSPKHTFPDHPEGPGRFDILTPRLNLFDALKVEVKPALKDEVARVHHPKLIAGLEEACKQGPAVIDPAPTFVTRSSFEDALLAAGGTLACTRSSVNRHGKKCLCACPPAGASCRA